MTSEIGELFVGAYLRVHERCPMVIYNVRDHDRGSQAEIDVLGIDYPNQRLFVCEVVTHLGGALYSSSKSGKSTNETVARLQRKIAKHRAVIARDFPTFTKPTFMIWSPYVAVGATTRGLEQLALDWPKGGGSLDVRINEKYAAAMQELLVHAAGNDGHTEEPFYRMCQLLTHLRTANNRRARVRIE